MFRVAWHREIESEHTKYLLVENRSAEHICDGEILEDHVVIVCVFIGKGASYAFFGCRSGGCVPVDGGSLCRSGCEGLNQECSRTGANCRQLFSAKSGACKRICGGGASPE